MLLSFPSGFSSVLPEVLQRSRLCTLALGLCLGAAASSAQTLPQAVATNVAATDTVTGAVRDSVSGLPLAGVLVELLSANETVLTRGLSSTNGNFGPLIASGAQSIRLRYLGYRPLTLPARNAKPVSVALLRLPSLLSTVTVKGQSACGNRNRRAAAQAYGLWEQLQAALLASDAAADMQSGILRRLRFKRDMIDERVTALWLDTDTAFAEPYAFQVARTAPNLMDSGFVRMEDDGPAFLAPDARVLTSSDFLKAYCISLVRGSTPEQIGVRFSPASRKRSRTDVEGVLQVDSSARRLVSLEYEYLMEDPQLRRLRPGGVLRFSQMPDGTTLTTDWKIRSVGWIPDFIPTGVAPRNFVQLNVKSGHSISRRRDGKVEVASTSEEGGYLLERAVPEGTWRAQTGTLVLRAATDTMGSGAPVVQLLRTPFQQPLERDRTATFRELIDGPYRVRLADPRADLLNVDLAADVQVTFPASRTLELPVRLHTLEGVAIDMCVSNRSWGDGSAPLAVVRVLDAEGKPAPRVIVSVRASNGIEGRNAIAALTTDGNGIAVWCGAPDLADSEVTINIERRGEQDNQVRKAGRTLSAHLLILKPNQ